MPATKVTVDKAECLRRDKKNHGRHPKRAE